MSQTSSEAPALDPPRESVGKARLRASVFAGCFDPLGCWLPCRQSSQLVPQPKRFSTGTFRTSPRQPTTHPGRKRLRAELDAATPGLPPEEGGFQVWLAKVFLLGPSSLREIAIEPLH